MTQSFKYHFIDQICELTGPQRQAVSASFKMCPPTESFRLLPMTLSISYILLSVFISLINYSFTYLFIMNSQPVTHTDNHTKQQIRQVFVPHTDQCSVETSCQCLRIFGAILQQWGHPTTTNPPWLH